jgi:putative tryptophan/tyrosine transport system substrate-binding protein
MALSEVFCLPAVDRRQVLSALGLIGAGSLGLHAPLARSQNIVSGLSPNVAMVTWRGETDVEVGFRDSIRANGWNPRLVTFDAAQDLTKLRVIAANLARTPPDLVYSWGTPATLGLVGPYDLPDPLFGSKVPHVFALVADPKGVKLVRDMALPERRITGVSHVPGVRIQWQAMSVYRPARRVAMLYNRAEPNSVAVVRDWHALAEREGFAVEALPFPLDDAGRPSLFGVDAAMASMKTRGADWLVLGPDTFLFSNLDAISQAAFMLGLPTFASTESQIAPRYPVLAGLISRFVHVGQLAGFKAQQLLSQRSNAPPVPIETLKRFSFVVRVNTAQQLNMPPPMALMEYAEFL